MTNTIFFDAVGTLIRVTGTVGEHYSQIARRFGAIVDSGQMHAAFRHAWKSMPVRPAVAGARPDDDKEWWRELVGRVLGTVLAPGQQFDREGCFEELYRHFGEPGVWEAYPEVAAVLCELRQRYRLAVISNFDRRLFRILENLGIADCFERVFVSSQVGADKPDPAIFRHALRTMNVAPSEALHVGDDPVHDWEGAARMGIPCFQLVRPRNSLRALLALR